MTIAHNIKDALMHYALPTNPKGKNTIPMRQKYLPLQTWRPIIYNIYNITQL